MQTDLANRARFAKRLMQGVMKMKIDKEDIIKAHDHSSNHYDEIMNRFLSFGVT